MSRELRVAIVGGGGAVEQEIATVLAERGFPISSLTALASVTRAGEGLEYGDETLPCGFADTASFDEVDLVFTAVDAQVAARIIPKATDAGAVVVDLTGAWRAYPDAPLLIPEVNGDRLAALGSVGVVGSPSSVAVPVAVALAPLHAAVGIKRVVVSTYQAVSDLGRPGLDELSRQITGLLSQDEYAIDVFPKRIAFNCVPQVGPFGTGGECEAEEELRHQLCRLLEAPQLGVAATCVYVPLFNGHGAALSVELAGPLSPEAAREVLKQAPGVMLMDDPAEGIYPTQADAESTEATLIGRVRYDTSVPHGLQLWCVADNLRKGTATNAVQVAELLARDHLARKA